MGGGGVGNGGGCGMIIVDALPSRSISPSSVYYFVEGELFQ